MLFLLRDIVPMYKKWLFLTLLVTLPAIYFFMHSLHSSDCKVNQIDFILVEKEKRRMHVYCQDKLIKTYKIALGFEPKGHKQQKGDGKTPEGSYVISYKNPNSQFYLSLKISYPDEKDRKSAQMKGFSPGSDIMIHGLGKAFDAVGSLHALKDWTLGCIAVTNKEIEEIYAATPVGTKIEIRP